MDDVSTRGGGGSRLWLSFALGLALGLALGGLLVGGARAQQRRARRALPWERARRPLARDSQEGQEGVDEWGSDGMRAARHWPEDAELDEELEQTFPASDPLPYSHRVD